jgi:methionine synthase (B12-independent) (EC 2.1.1.14)
MSRPADNRAQFHPDDHPNDHFLLTTVVGSYPKPKWLNRADELVDDDESKFDAENLEEAHDDAARVITNEHERCGLDTVVDGEVRRNEMVEFFAERIDGYEFNGPVKVWGHNYFDKPSVSSEVGYDEPWLVDEFAFTDNVASKPVKVPITGPYTLGCWAFNEAYDSQEELVYELASLSTRRSSSWSRPARDTSRSTSQHWRQRRTITPSSAKP